MCIPITKSWRVWKTEEIIQLVMNVKMRLRWAVFFGLMMRKWAMVFGRRMWDIWGYFEGLNLWLFWRKIDYTIQCGQELVHPFPQVPQSQHHPTRHMSETNLSTRLAVKPNQLLFLDSNDGWGSRSSCIWSHLLSSYSLFLHYWEFEMTQHLHVYDL